MANHIFILAAVMLLAGVFGGLVNFYLNSQTDPDATSLPRCIVVGIGASFLVPVILDIVSSELIIESQADPSKLLIFTGFCLIAAIISRFFISSISERILLQAQTAHSKTDDVQYDLRLIKEELLPLIETETEQDVDNIYSDADVYQAHEELDVTSSKVLKTLGTGRYIFRSIVGLCREANADENTITRTLAVLVARDLAGRVSGKNGVRWYITDKGRRVLESI